MTTKYNMDLPTSSDCEEKFPSIVKTPMSFSTSNLKTNSKLKLAKMKTFKNPKDSLGMGLFINTRNSAPEIDADMEEEINQMALESPSPFKHEVKSFSQAVIKQIPKTEDAPEVKLDAINDLLDIYTQFERKRLTLKKFLDTKYYDIQIRKNKILTKWDEIFNISNQLESTKLQFLGLKMYGDVFLQFRDLDQAISRYKIAKDYAQNCLKHKYKLITHSQLGYCYCLKSKYDKALRYYKKQLQLSWDLDNKLCEYEAYDKMGLMYFYLGDSERALFYHNKAMEGNFEAKSSPVKTIAKKCLHVKKRAFIEDFSSKFLELASLGKVYLEKKWVEKEKIKSMARIKNNFQKCRKQMEENTIKIKKPQKEKKQHDLDDLPSPRTFSLDYQTRIRYVEKEEERTKTKRNRAGVQCMADRLFPELKYINIPPKMPYLKIKQIKKENEGHLYNMSVRNTRLFKERNANSTLEGLGLKKKVDLKEKLSTRLEVSKEAEKEEKRKQEQEAEKVKDLRRKGIKTTPNTPPSYEEEERIKRFKEKHGRTVGIPMPLLPANHLVHLSSLRNSFHLFSYPETIQKLHFIIDKFHTLLLSQIQKILAKSELLTAFNVYFNYAKDK